jgi:CheY-like chemotaxis protein
MTNILTTAQVANYCKVSLNTVIGWLKQGKLKSHKGEDNSNSVSKEAFIDFLESHKLPVPQELTENSHKRLLIVDDDVSIVEMMKELLSDIRGLEIETAKCGHEAGTQIASFKPHIIILDLWMPGINGFEVCRHLKYNPETSGIKILAITGYPCDQAMKKINNIGADYFFEKPLDTEELRKIVHTIMDGDKKPEMQITSQTGKAESNKSGWSNQSV